MKMCNWYYSQEIDKCLCQSAITYAIDLLYIGRDLVLQLIKKEEMFYMEQNNKKYIKMASNWEMNGEIFSSLSDSNEKRVK